MSETASTFSQLSNIQFELKKKYPFKDISLTESMSLYSDIPQGFEVKMIGLKKVDARKAIGIIVLTAASDHPLKHLIWEHFQMECKKHNYEGKWMKVHKLLKLWSLRYILYEYLDSVGSENDLFGNVLNNSYSTFLNIKLIRIKPPKPQEPQRKRGYNDHGSRRESHKWLPSNFSHEEYKDSWDFTNQIKGIRNSALQFLYG